MINSKIYDRAAGCLAGVAVGDVLGLPTEFLDKETIESIYGYIDGLVDIAKIHPHYGNPRGCVSDDTLQTLVISEILCRYGKITPENVAKGLINWAKKLNISKSSFSGPSTKAAIKKIINGVDPTKSGIEGDTVGSSMRVSPIGIFNFGQPQKAAEAAVLSSLPTHGNKKATSGAASVAAAISIALVSKNKEEVIESAYKGAIYGREHGVGLWVSKLEKKIELAIRITKDEDDEDIPQIIYDYIGLSMDPMELIPAVFSLFYRYCDNPMTAIKIASNLGGDSDTLGSISGSLCGAFSGLGKFNSKILQEIERVNELDIRGLAGRLLQASEYFKR